jgi:hypothetical protein
LPHQERSSGLVKKGADLKLAQLERVPLAVEEDELACPMDVRFLSSTGVVLRADDRFSRNRLTRPQRGHLSADRCSVADFGPQQLSQ